jgi:putative sterol carrier protein
MTEFNVDDLTAGDPIKFAAQVKAASSAQLTELMSGELRGKLLDEIFARMPKQFRPDRAGSTSAVIHWIISGRPDGGADTYELVVADGACTLSPTPEHEAKVALSLGGPEFLNLVTGNGNPMMMFMTGKLKAKGDLGLAANLANLFDMPKG